jgi:ABC-type bacteriocin/lantibiotic exporter with double-glycine peptidase domain
VTPGMPQRLAALLCLCGLLGAAQTAGLWLDVPFVKQEKDGCGAASIAMVMQYWQKQAGGVTPGSDAALIQRALYSPKAHGIYASDMEHYFQQQGFKTFVFAGTWDDLRQHLEKGRPLIAALKPSPGESSRHYVVVVGVDTKQNLVLVNDAAQRKLLKEDRGIFEKEWSAVGHWTLLAVPQPQRRQ